MTAARSLVRAIQVIRLHVLPLDGVGETDRKVVVDVCDVDAFVVAAFPGNLDDLGAVDRYKERVVREQDQAAGVFLRYVFSLRL